MVGQWQRPDCCGPLVRCRVEGYPEGFWSTCSRFSQTPCKWWKSMSVESSTKPVAWAVAAIQRSFCCMGRAGFGGGAAPGASTILPCVQASMSAYARRTSGWSIPTTGKRNRTLSRWVLLGWPQPNFSANARSSPWQITEVQETTSLALSASFSSAANAHGADRTKPNRMFVSKESDPRNHPIGRLHEALVEAPRPARHLATFRPTP